MNKQSFVGILVIIAYTLLQFIGFMGVTSGAISNTVETTIIFIFVPSVAVLVYVIYYVIFLFKQLADGTFIEAELAKRTTWIQQEEETARKISEVLQ